MSYQPPAGPPPGRAAPKNQAAVGALVAGISGIVLELLCLFGFVFSIVAVVLGVVAMNQIHRSGGAQRGRKMALAGIILGGIGIAFIVTWRIVVYPD